MTLLLATDFMPHGYCYLWNPQMVWLHVVSDSLITLSYYCIPMVLIYFARKGRDVAFNRVFWMFGTFILACGTTHLMEVWNIWHGDYLAAGIIKAFTAAVSVMTAAMIVPLLPQAIALPARIRLEEVNRQLEQRLAERKRLDDEIAEASLERKEADRSRIDPRLVQRLSAFASASAVFSVVVGLACLAGWKFHIASLENWGVGLATMKANTAGCFVLIGVAFWLLRETSTQPSQTGKFAARGLAGLVVLLSFFSLVERLVDRNFGIDALLAVAFPVRSQPGLMSPITAAAFLLLGLALLLLDWRTKRQDWPSQFLCLGAAVCSAFGLLAWMIEPDAGLTPMAMPTAVIFFLLAGGLLSSRPTWAVGGLLTSPSSGARLLRKAVPAALLALFLLGAVISKPLFTETHFTWVEGSLLAILCTGLLAGFIVWISFVIDRSEAERRKLQGALSFSQEQLDRLMASIDEPEAEGVLLRRVTVGFAVAVLLTALLGFFSWQNARQVVEDADWVSHAHQVMTLLEATLRHLLDVETGGRGFAVTGERQFLEPYDSGRVAVGEDLQALHRLVMDNSGQKERLQRLAEQARSQIDDVEEVVTAREITKEVPALGLLLRGKQIMDAARLAVAEMEAREKNLLEQRNERARRAQRFNSSVILASSLFGVVFLSIAGGTVRREIGVSARARAQISALNADLERRVEERTEALGESEGRLAGIIHSAMDAIITVDEGQTVLLFNAAAEKMFRCPAAQALGGPIARFIPERFHAAHAAHIKRFGEKGVTSRAVGAINKLRAVRADGEEFQIEASISQTVTRRKKLFTVILRDVTERTEAERMRDRLAGVVEYCEDAIISKTPLDGTIIDWNRGAEKIFGYTAAEMIGKPMIMLIPPERVSEEADILARIRRGESVEHYETVRVRKDGKKIDVSLTISPVRDSSGAIIGASKIARDITERKQAEAALRESQMNFAAVVNLAPQFVWICTNEGLNIYFNDRWYQYTGLTPEQSLGTGWNTPFHPDDKQTAWDHWNQATIRGSTYSVESRLRAADGSYRWFLMRGEPVRDPNGGIVKWFGTCTDIHEMKEAQAAFRESEERFQAMANGIPQLAWMAEADGSIFWYNQRWYDYTGTTFEQMQGWGWEKVQDPEMLPAVLKGWQAAIAAGRVFDMEFPLRAANGEFHTFLTRVMPLKNAEGRVVRWFGTNTDISERKHAEERLARQADELSRSRIALEKETLMLTLVLDSVGEGLIAADPDGHFLIWNNSAKKLLGRGPAALPPEQWSSHYACYEADGARLVETDRLPLVRALKGESLDVEFMVRPPGNEQAVYLEFTARPMKDSHGQLCGGVVAFRDTTERRVAEKEIRALNDGLELRVAQRTAELEDANKELEAFTYSVSHDLRAPLRHIAGFSGLLQEEYGDKLEPQAQHYLKRIADGVRKMGQLVDELLTLARVGRQTVSMQVTGLDSIVKEIVEMLKPDYEGRNVEWKIGQMPFVECDPTLMKQVFQNLISNALKYSRPREKTVIEIGQIEIQDKGNTIFVRDNGVGFSMKYVDKLFGVFQRLHRPEDFEGTGVGLATVQRIIHKHGGKVWAEAGLDRGATFYFTLAEAGKEESQATGAAIGAGV